jgi:hypothetical protein
MDTQFDMDEVKEAIKEFSNIRAPGFDLINAVVLKNLPES